MRRSKRGFGIELEFECPWEHLKKNATKAIREVYGNGKYYCRKDCFDSDNRLDKWHIKEDGLSSISELTTPVSYTTDLPKIKKVVKALGKCELNPSDACGFHVHIDIPDIDQYHFLAGWMIYEKAIFSCFPIDRRKSVHCEKILDYPQLSKSYIAKVLEQKLMESDHSHAISLSHYEERKTVEVRIGEGTDNEKFVVAWVEFLLYFAEHIKSFNPSLISCKKCNSVDFWEMIQNIRMKNSVSDFMEERYQKYGKLPYWVH
jgi:hypothetical protein